MPRTIPDLEHKILCAAGRLFIEKGYAGVTMNQVAAEAGTSVGNIYNYYPAKKDLFLAGRRIWMESFSDEIIAEAGNGQDPIAELEAMLLKMMRGISRWAGLWEEFMAVLAREVESGDLKTMKKQLRVEFHDYAIARVQSLLDRAAAGNDGLEKLVSASGSRLAVVLVSMLKTLAIFYPEDGEENKKFVHALLTVLCSDQPGAEL